MNKAVAQIDKAIAIISRAGNKINMCRFQTKEEWAEYVFAEEELHTCGNTVCFAGYIAISPEFKAAGGFANEVGRPVINVDGADVMNDDAIAEWMNISTTDAFLLVFGSTRVDGYCSYYRKKWNKVTYQDVIEKLYQLRAKYSQEQENVSTV